MWENLWSSDCKDKSLGPKDFWLTPLILQGFVASAYLSGANAIFCLGLAGGVQAWQLWQACALDETAYRSTSGEADYIPIGA
jgi:hypothetical protein